ncbi:hypothetical protein KMT30_03430 [Streptomyces sp. IBSBF 2953]|uniref:hypothetical protein n=1 Tax=Streptomyces TaxID=1883 RepID=UPI00211A4389|nr:hypothetical protein [Streptomyces scabiei]MCQ9178106.1 hypothetical protein [Streptomyces hayashii]MDX3114803.1 hypothetical protein [Streptomyces scabiei]
MRKLTISLATLGLAALGIALPATAHAGPGCNANWNSHGRDGNVRAWDGTDCGGTLLGVTPGNDSDWQDAVGPFQGSDGDAASSVMNSGYVGGKDVVAFYYLKGYDDHAYGCLKPGELFVDDLSRSKFTDGVHNMNNNIRSHVWVAASACAPGSFIS